MNIVTLSDVFRSDWTMSMREPYRSNGFVPLNTALLDGQSGGVVTIAGETPLLVHKSAVEPDIIDAIRTVPNTSN
jgi:hypothetical protein